MPHSTLLRAALGAVFALLLPLAPVQAQRFVATTGDDGLDCLSHASACRSLQRAHDVAFAGDKIIVLDSGNFFPLTITKSIAIAAIGVHGGIRFSATSLMSAIIIDAGPDDVIDIDGLAVDRNGQGGDDSGIEFISGGRLNVRNCTIRNVATAGIHIRGSGAKRIVVSDCTIADNKHGVWARGGGGNVHLLLDRVTIDGNTGNGVRSQGSGARVRINRSVVTNNGTGLKVVNGGKIISFGNNVVAANGNNGAPTATASLK